MTSEEVKAAIGRLRSQYDDGYGYSLNDVACAFLGESHGMGVVSPSKLRDALIRLLEQADPESYVELPTDKDGEPIRIGYEMDFCEGACGLTVLGVGISDINDGDMGVFILDDDGYTWFNARFLRHHRPTFEDVVRDMLNDVVCTFDASGGCSAWMTDTKVTEYADRLREVMKDDE